MTLQTMCMGCMKEKGTAAVCPQCSFDEGEHLASPLYLPLRTLLQARSVMGRVLGAGGFGITYLSWDSTLALRVAIKEFFPRYLAVRSTDGVSVSAYQGELAAFTYGLERFLEEGRLLARFAEHPGIVTVRDFFTAHHTGYLVMNYLDGVTLHNYLTRQGGRIPFHQALAILIPVMDTLQEIHVAGLLHRDISPDNIFLPTGQNTWIILPVRDNTLRASFWCGSMFPARLWRSGWRMDAISTNRKSSSWRRCSPRCCVICTNFRRR